MKSIKQILTLAALSTTVLLGCASTKDQFKDYNRENDEALSVQFGNTFERYGYEIGCNDGAICAVPDDVATCVTYEDNKKNHYVLIEDVAAGDFLHTGSDAVLTANEDEKTCTYKGKEGTFVFSIVAP